EEVAALRRDLGGRVCGLPPRLVKCRQRSRKTARRGDFEERSTRGRGEDNDALAIPGTAASPGCITERLRRPTDDVDLVQLSRGEIRNELCIGRPERKCRVRASANRLARHFVQSA